MKSNEEFKRKMLALLKSDYGIELWNVGGGFVRVSFYHLGSVYNALCSGFVGDDEPSVNWQYARPNKKAEKLVKWITQYIITYYSENNNIDYIESEFDYFKKLSGAVFDAKYSTEMAHAYDHAKDFCAPEYDKEEKEKQLEKLRHFMEV